MRKKGARRKPCAFCLSAAAAGTASPVCPSPEKCRAGGHRLLAGAAVQRVFHYALSAPRLTMTFTLTFTLTGESSRIVQNDATFHGRRERKRNGSAVPLQCYQEQKLPFLQGEYEGAGVT